MSKKNSNKITIEELKKENQRLRRENLMLKTELEELHGHPKKEKRGKYLAAFQRQSKNEQLFSKKSYFGYLYAALQRTSVFQIYSQIIHTIRRLTFIRITVIVLLAIFAAVQSSAIFVIATSFFVVSLPFTLLVSNSAMILTFFGRKKINGINRERIQGKTITVFFPKKGYSPAKTPFLCGMIYEDTQKEGHITVVVSPYVFNTRGVSGKTGKPYFSARYDPPGILLVRSPYYFTLKKKIFSESAGITEIY